MPSAFTGPTQHQAYQGLPKLDTPFIDPNGHISIVWYRFLITLWFKSGGSFTQQQLSQSLQSESGGTVIIDNTTGSNEGTVITSETPIPPPFVNAGLAVAVPDDQQRQQLRPGLPTDQLHIPARAAVPMDQFNSAAAANLSLSLGHPY